MKHLFKKLLGTKSSLKAKSGVRLGVESLEDRLMPVVGAFSLVSLSRGGSPYDGVVQLDGGTGTNMADGRHILTAAHIYDTDGTTGTLGADRGANIQYLLARGSTQLSISVPVAANYIIVNPNWGGATNFNNGNDLAIIPLIDPINSAADRQMIAPYTAQRYALFTGNALNQTFTMVGYGETGTGDIGERSDEVQQVNINQSWGLPSGSFTLTFNGQTTGLIPANATAAQVATRLGALSTIGNDASGTPNVSVLRVSPGIWNVRFGSYGNAGGMGATTLGWSDVPQMTGNGAYLLSLPLLGRPQVRVTTLFDGNPSGNVGVRRLGQNTIDQITGNFTRYDFDNGTAAQNALGGLGVGITEAMGSRGDSGGPGLIYNSTLQRWEEVFVKSMVEGPGSTDLTDYRLPNNSRRADFSFGEISKDTLIQPYVNSFINPNLAGSYHLVLDMNYQELGVDGMTENLTITARRNGSNVEIVVGGSADSRMNGVYYSAPLSEIKSLTLRGSDDNETFVVDGSLNMGITIDGRGGSNAVQVLDQSAAGMWNNYLVNSSGMQRTAGSFILFPNGKSTTFNQILNVSVANVSALDIRGSTVLGSNYDVGNLPYSTSSLSITAGGKDDAFHLGPTLDHLSTSRGHARLTVNGGGGAADQLVLDDTKNAEQDFFGNPSFTINATTISRRHDLSAVLGYEFIMNVDIAYSGFENVEIDGGDSNDEVVIEGTLAGTALALKMGLGNDTVYVGGWSLDAVKSSLALDGGAGDKDALIVRDLLADHVDGVRSKYSITANVIQARHAAIGYGLFENITLVTSNWEDDVTVASAPANAAFTIWTMDGDDRVSAGAGIQAPLTILGGAGKDTLQGGSGRDLIIGGADVDALDGGPGEDIVIAGETTYDLEPEALAAVMTEWQRADLPYANRVDHVLFGGGLNGSTLLNRASYIKDNGLNTLGGSADLDLFFASSLKDTTDWNRPLGEILVDSDNIQAAVHIDAGALSGSTFMLDNVSHDPALPFTVMLSPGQHFFYTYGSTTTWFNVNADGTVDYAPELEGVLTGRGTASLKISGAQVQIDASRDT